MIKPENGARGSDAWTSAQRTEYRTEPGKPEAAAQRDSMIRTSDGSIALALQTNLAEDVEVVFDPPLVTVPAALVPGKSFEQTTTMTVHPIADLKKTQARGQVRQTISLAGNERIRTPAGEFDAIKISALFDADLGATKVKNRTEQWLVAGAGLVAERRSERTTLLGVAIRSKDEFWLLNRSGAAAPEAGTDSTKK
jgi:hypothetical protein